MPVGISTLCIFGKSLKNVDQLLNLDIGVLEVLEDWRDHLNKASMRKLVDIKASREIILTVHSPILDMNIASSNERFRSISLKQVLESIDHAHEIGAELVVVHPGNKSPLDFLFPKLSWNLNRQSLQKIISYGEDRGIRVCIENMPRNNFNLLQNAEEFRDLVDEGLPVEMTLDIGHANTTGQLLPFLSTMAGRIGHVHIHDNTGAADDHMIVGNGTVDWSLIKSKIDLKRITGVIESNTVTDAEASLLKVRNIYRM